jgi:hypothetical protein
MKKLLISISLVCCVPAFLQAQCPSKKSEKTLIIRWEYTPCQSENPCERCATEPQEIKYAVEKLHAALQQLDIKVVFDKLTDDVDNERLIINGMPLEELVNATLVKRQCGSCPGTDGEEKTYSALELNGIVYEIIPADLIIQAGLRAASDLFAIQHAIPCKTKSPCQGCPANH